MTSSTAREIAASSRTVFKPVLDSPFAQAWPSAPAAVRRQILTELIRALEPIGAHRTAAKQLASAAKRVKRNKKAAEDAPAPTEPSEGPSAPPIASSIVTGINSVTKALELQSAGRVTRKRKRDDEPFLVPTQPDPAEEAESGVTATSPISLVFVCRPDINPPALIAHLPLLVAAVNSQSKQAITLVPLDTGAEVELGRALELPRAAVVAVRTDAPGCKALEQLVRHHLKPPTAPWLGQPDGSLPELASIHIKHLATPAPPPKAAKKQPVDKKQPKQPQQPKQPRQTKKQTA